MKKSIYLMVGAIAIALSHPTPSSSQIISTDMIKEKAIELSKDVITNAQEMLGETKENLLDKKEDIRKSEVILFSKQYNTIYAPTARLSIAKSNYAAMKQIYEEEITEGERKFPIENYEFSDSVAGSHPFDIRTKVTTSPLNKGNQLLFITMKARPGLENSMIAKDVFSSIEFNPNKIKSYKLLGHINAELPEKERDYRYNSTQLALNAQLMEEVTEGNELCFIFELTLQDSKTYQVAKTLRYQSENTINYEKEKGMITLTYTPPKGRKSWTITHPLPLKVE